MNELTERDERKYSKAELLEFARKQLHEITEYCNGDALRNDMDLTDVRSVLLDYIETALQQGAQGGAEGPDLSDLSPEAKERRIARMEQAFPILSAFHSKYACGSLLCPSCLKCGQMTQPEDRAIQHAELPDIFICKSCASPQPSPSSEGLPDSNVCPDCFRFKARSAIDASKGYCSKWWAVRDKEADQDCSDFRHKRGYFALPTPPKEPGK